MEVISTVCFNACEPFNLCYIYDSNLSQDPEACNTVYESSLTHCLRTTCASHLIWTDVSVVSLGIPHCSKGEAYRQHQWYHMGRRGRGSISKEFTPRIIKDP